MVLSEGPWPFMNSCFFEQTFFKDYLGFSSFHVYRYSYQVHAPVDKASSMLPCSLSGTWWWLFKHVKIAQTLGAWMLFQGIVLAWTFWEGLEEEIFQPISLTWDGSLLWVVCRLLRRKIDLLLSSFDARYWVSALKRSCLSSYLGNFY